MKEFFIGISKLLNDEDFRIPSFYFLGSRGILFILFWFSLLAFSIKSPGLWRGFEHNLFLDGFARYDSGWYGSILDVGYRYDCSKQSNVAFFPIYPISAILVSNVFFISNKLSALILTSHLYFGVALVFFYKLLGLYGFDSSSKHRGLFYLTAFPSAFFFSCAYSESTFLCFSLISFYYARKRCWFRASCFAAILSATRVTGIVFWGVLIAEWAYSHGFLLSRLYRKDTWVSLYQAFVDGGYKGFLLIQLSWVGLLSYSYYLYSKFGEPLAFYKIQSNWAREQKGFLTTLWDGTEFLFFKKSWMSIHNAISYSVVIDVVFTWFALFLVIPVWRRYGAPLGLFMIVSLIVPLNSSMTSMPRYVILLFPIYMLLAEYGKNAFFDRVWISFSIAFQALLIALFANWYWVA